MATILFFMDPECNESQCQRESLQEAGNILECRDIGIQKWQKDDLLPYVRNREPLKMINSNAAIVKSGKIDPILLSFDEALLLMTEFPELIQGPLVQVDGLHIQGTQDRRLEKYNVGTRSNSIH